VMRFGRFVRADLDKTGEKPDTFDFLGFNHVCGTDRGGKFALVRVPRRQPHLIPARRSLLLCKPRGRDARHPEWKFVRRFTASFETPDHP
jgi:hypothetical protein